MELSDADIERLARMARLRLGAEERATVRADLERMLHAFAVVRAADDPDTAPLLRPGDLVSRGRDDHIAVPAGSAALPQSGFGHGREEGRLRVPRTAADDA